MWIVILRVFLWLLALLAALPAQAGSIGFSISFSGDDIALTSSGSEPAYQVSAWTLDDALHWQRVPVLSGNAAYLPPGQGIKGRRLGAAAPTGLGRADPLLVLLHDQAGSPIAQLAWRQAPAAHPQPLPSQRSGAQLSVAADAALEQKIMASYAVAVPYEGVQQLAKPRPANAAPPDPLRHVWAAGAPLLLATGTAQGGTWLVHESAGGALSVQIVPDGVARGQEQVPAWLAWARLHLLRVAAWLAGLGALMGVGGWLGARGLSRLPTLPQGLSQRPYGLLLDLAVVLAGALLIASVLGIGFLRSGNLPTGGDSASHLLYVWTYARELLPRGQITAWMPEVFGGFAFLSYYFPLSFISIAALAQVLPFAPAMKLGMFAGALLLPGAVWLGSVYLLRLPRAVAIWGVLASLTFLLHEQNSIWGGNLLSTLAGEFAYSYGMLLSMLTLMAWQRSVRTGRHWWLAALLEAATGFSHGFALLITGFATAAFLLDRRNFWRNLRLLALGHGLAFFLLAGWLWPMLQMHSLTIPNDALFEITRWQELLPQPLQPVLAAGVAATLLLFILQLTQALRGLEPVLPAVDCSLRHAAFMAGAALLAGVGFLAGGSIGVANIRFFPFVWLFGGLACAWVWGALLLRLGVLLPRLARGGWHLMSVAAGLALLGWTCLQVLAAPDWGLWNHSGLEAKPQWQRLSQLFPALAGRLDSPRLTFEHDPANNDIGSTRALEALPMFLGGRPVLEGLYMESAPVGPAIYQLQSEVSTHPSSPLARFPSGSLDLERAAAHMNFLWANQVLIRHDDTFKAFAASPLFTEVASAAPFHVFQLKAFDSQWVDIVDTARQPLRWLPTQNWMQASFAWFKSAERFSRELPVFHAGAAPQIVAPAAGAQVHDLKLERQKLSWRTDAVGAAHLVRVAWHPRWKLATQGQLYLAGPGFMLVVPGEANVVLEYGHTPVGLAGMVASALALLVLLALMWRDFLCRSRAPATKAVQTRPSPKAFAARAQLQQDSPPSTPWPRDRLAALWPLLLICAGLWLHLHNPERLYTNAWVLMRANQPAQAAPAFDQAYAARQGDAKKEEALFWAAKAYEQAGQRDAALARYRDLTTHFHGYWLPESLYTQSHLEQAVGASAPAQSTRARLLQEFPNDRWTQRLKTEATP
ncbi:MAG: hypothetical protein AUJ20_01590 [Comamonadaceae bacterium CG1_02_60_18]|nr:MAG: hypothetical protein AUJ20_01590 [Comamonadaceae bacterium CG1_02_60_18]PIQ51747.1 MAG: hypothetical protein COW02_13680 [Comamonadaceae bacterium CG12_big_fil_rev_8_21_14_0_65_59_15]